MHELYKIHPCSLCFVRDSIPLRFWFVFEPDAQGPNYAVELRRWSLWIGFLEHHYKPGGRCCQRGWQDCGRRQTGSRRPRCGRLGACYGTLSAVAAKVVGRSSFSMSVLVSVQPRPTISPTALHFNTINSARLRYCFNWPSDSTCYVHGHFCKTSPNLVKYKSALLLFYFVFHLHSTPPTPPLVASIGTQQRDGQPPSFYMPFSVIYVYQYKKHFTVCFHFAFSIVCGLESTKDSPISLYGKEAKRACKFQYPFLIGLRFLVFSNLKDYCEIMIIIVCLHLRRPVRCTLECCGR